MKRKALAIVGTRPEAIKMAPVILAMRGANWLETKVVATAQHRNMLDQVLGSFGIVPDIDLDIMRPNQSLTELTARLLNSVGNVLEKEKPNLVIAQGDTTTVLATALACFYHRTPFGHVEAGLRTGDLANPFPEEANRVIASYLAHSHFAPTESARQNLLREGIKDELILVTGNTVIDALLLTASLKPKLELDPGPDRKLVLVTAHRRENFGEPLRKICKALQRLAGTNPDVSFLYPVHPNPNVQTVVQEMLGSCANINLSPPLDYTQFVAAMQRSHLILTDSGGIQEEAPALGKPVLVLREETERPEAVACGAAKLVGADESRIVANTQLLLDDESAWRAMVPGGSPYGDGNAAQRIVAWLQAQSDELAAITGSNL